MYLCVYVSMLITIGSFDGVIMSRNIDTGIYLTIYLTIYLSNYISIEYLYNYISI
jgi:hypothetical protein